MNKHLTESQINLLREKNIISENEIAFKSGDLLVAENVLTGDKRIVENGNAVLRESRGLLKG